MLRFKDDSALSPPASVRVYERLFVGKHLLWEISLCPNNACKSACATVEDDKLASDGQRQPGESVLSVPARARQCKGITAAASDRVEQQSSWSKKIEHTPRKGIATQAGTL
jgi:hypothetical protein